MLKITRLSVLSPAFSSATLVPWHYLYDAIRSNDSVSFSYMSYAVDERCLVGLLLTGGVSPISFLISGKKLKMLHRGKWACAIVFTDDDYI